MNLALLACATLSTLAACHRASVEPPIRSAPRQSSAPTPDSASAVTLVRGTFTAIARGDTAALRRDVSESLRWHVVTRGAVIGNAQLLSAASRTNAVVTLSYQVDSIRVWQLGAVATAEYRLVDSRTFGQHTNAFDTRGMDVFAWEGDAWRLWRHTQTWVVGPPAVLSLDTAAARAFVGRYQRGSGFVDDVYVVDGVLRAQSSAEKRLGSPGARLLQVSEDTFSPEGSAPMIVFERDARGRVVGYVQQEPDGTIVRARKLPNR